MTTSPARTDVKHLTISPAEVFELLDHTVKQLKQIQRMIVKSYDLTASQYFILSVLWNRDKRPLNELADAFHCTRATITGIVDTLESRKLVIRKTNPADRRSVVASLTDKGHKLKEELPDFNSALGHCCVSLTDSELQTLAVLLRKLSSSCDCSGR